MPTSLSAQLQKMAIANNTQGMNMRLDFFTTPMPIEEISEKNSNPKCPPRKMKITWDRPSAMSTNSLSNLNSLKLSFSPKIIYKLRLPSTTKSSSSCP
jgi:hypothetical protein